MDEIISKGEYEVYGLRFTDIEYKIGDVLPKSHNWFQDDPNENDYLDYEIVEKCVYDPEIGIWDAGELEGTSTIGIRDAGELKEKLQRGRCYGGAHVYLVGGDDYEEGIDPEEYIIHNATVVGVIR